MSQYGSLLGVELAAVGMEWPAHPVPATITLENLVDMMVAANDDPLIRKPRIKLGHERWQLSSTGTVHLDDDHDPFWQGEPAMGSIINLRLNDEGTRLLGDLVGLPWWMAEAAPAAWPNRSPEWVWDITTEGGRRYSAVLTAVALLGVQQQAIKSLKDLEELMVDGPHEEEESA